MPSDLTTAQRRLTAAQARMARQELGPPLTLTDFDMTVLTNVGPTDQPEVTAYVRATTGERGVALLEAL